jgi:hypothetical protein
MVDNEYEINRLLKLVDFLERRLDRYFYDPKSFKKPVYEMQERKTIDELNNKISLLRDEKET